MYACVTTPCLEKVWNVLGLECAQDAGRMELIMRALYRLKCAGAAFRNQLGHYMNHMSYTSCLSDPDLQIKAEIRPDDGEEYFDDVLSMHHDAQDVIRRLDRYFKLKPESLGDLHIYLGTKLRKTQTENGVWSCALSPACYIHEAVRNVEKNLRELRP